MVDLDQLANANNVNNQNGQGAVVQRAGEDGNAAAAIEEEKQLVGV